MATIYTAIIGDYDELKEPRVITEGWDYVCFTDQDIQSDVWQIKKVSSYSSNTTLARFLKWHPNEFIKDKFTMWLDASIEVQCDLTDFVDKYHQGSLSLLKHGGRNCIYQEAEACKNIGKDRPITIDQQMKRYRSEKYPENNGLVATGLIIREGNSKMLSDRMWTEIQNGSIRDQLSFNYVAWKYRMNFNLIPFQTILDNEFNWQGHKK